MALHFDLSKIANRETLCQVPDLDENGIQRKDKDGDLLYTFSPVTNILVMGTMFIDMGEITKENWRDFYTRLHMVELLGGVFLYETETQPDGRKTPKERPITIEDVKAHIGLKCNVATVPWKRWLKHKTEQRYTDIIRNLPKED